MATTIDFVPDEEVEESAVGFKPKEIDFQPDSEQAALDAYAEKPEIPQTIAAEQLNTVGTPRKSVALGGAPELTGMEVPYVQDLGSIKAGRPLTTVEKLQQVDPTLWGRPGEENRDLNAPPSGILPNVAQVVLGKQTEPGEPEEPGLLRFSPATVIPKQEAYGAEIARQALGMVNIENLGIVKAMGLLKGIANPHVRAGAEGAVRAYFAEEGVKLAYRDLETELLNWPVQTS